MSEINRDVDNDDYDDDYYVIAASEQPGAGVFCFIIIFHDMITVYVKCVHVLKLQGLGMYALEEHRFTADGHLETIGARKYHIPTVSSVPLEMNVTLLKDSGNPKTVYSSKVLHHCI